MRYLKSILKKIMPQSIQRRILQKRAEESISVEYKNFLETGKTSPEAFNLLIDLYSSTNGKFNEVFHNRIKSKNIPKMISGNLEGIPGSFSPERFKNVNSELNENGYIRFDKRIEREVCEKIQNFALKTPAALPPNYDRKMLYDPERPQAEWYQFDRQEVANNLEIQQLMMDPVLLNVARNYLGCEPIFDFPALWWSTAFRKEASHEAAQLYHFDLDRIKWLKIFFYINDVNSDNGPHCYVRASHKPGNKPEELLKRGYARIPDSDLKMYYKEQDFVELCDSAGAIFAGDTKCWHKGKNLRKGHRLVLEFEYTGCMFGANYPKLEISNYSPEFKKFCTDNKVYSSNINLR
jgi:hypothetical protein